MASPWPRRIRNVGLVLLTLLVAAVALLQLPPVATWLARRLVTLAPLNPGYEIAVGGATGNWFTGLQLENVRLLHRGRELADVARLRVAYDPRELLGVRVRLQELTVDGAKVAAQREAGGWDIADALRSSPDTGGGGGVAIERLNVRGVDLVARFSPDSAVRVRNLRLRGRNLMTGDRLLVTIDTLGAAVSPPGDPAVWFEVAARGAATREVIRLEPLRIHTDRSEIAGRAVVPRSFDDPRTAGRLDVRLEALPLALADLAAIYPAVPAEGALRLEASATARGRLATATLAARLDEATLRLTGTTMLGHDAPAVVRVSGDVARLDPSRLYRSAPEARLTGELEADLRGPTLAGADGSAALRLDDSRVGDSRIEALDLTASVDSGRADLRVRGELLGTTIRARGSVRPFDSIPEYRMTGSARDVPGTAAAARALAGDSGSPVLDVAFRVEGQGVSTRTARLTGRVDLSAVRRSGERIDLGQATLALHDRRLELRPELLVAGGRITGLALVTLADTITYRVRDGRLAGVDLARLLGDTAAAPVSGRFSLRGSGTAPEEAVAGARLDLDELRYGAVRLDGVTGDVRLADGRAGVDLQAGLQGGRLSIEGSGRPFDSIPRFTLRRAALDRVDLGTMMGRPDLAGPFSMSASASGRWGESVRSVRGRATIEPSTLGRLTLTGGTIETELEGERLTYEAALRTSGGALELAGDGRPMADIPSFAVRRGSADSLDLGVLLGDSALRTAISAGFTASVAGRALDSLRARLDLDLRPSRVNQARIGPGSAELALDHGAASGTIRLRGEDAEVNARLSAEVGSPVLARADGTVRIEHLARWTGRQDADGRVEGRFGLEARADSAGLYSIGGSITAAGGVGAVRMRTLHLALTPAPGVVQVDTVVFRSNVAALDGSGRLALRGDWAGDTLRVAGRGRDIAPLAQLAGIDSVSLDSTRLSMIATGPAGEWLVQGRAEAYRLLYGSVLAEKLVARGGATMDSTGPARLAGDVRLEGAAAGRIIIKEAAVAARYDSVVVLRGNAALGDGEVRLGFDLSGTAQGDSVRARLARLELVEGGRTWSLRQPTAVTTRPGAIEVDGLVLAAADRSLSLDGVLDRRGVSDLTLRLSGLDLDALEEVRVSPVAGRLDGALHLRGPARSPEIEGQLALTVRRPDDPDLGRIESSLAWTRSGLRLDAAAVLSRGGRLTVDGTLPWRLTLAPADTASRMGVERSGVDTMALAVRSDSFDLAFFDPFLPEDAARDLRGALRVNARVGGTPDEPRATGPIDVRGLEVTLPSLALGYERGTLAGRLEGEKLLVDSLTLATGDDERLVARGAVRLRPLGEPALDLTARLHDFRISNSPPLRGTASGELALTGTLARPVATGDLSLGPAELVIGAGSGAAVEEVELTPKDLREVARYFGPAVLARADEGPGLLDRFALDLRVSFPRRVWFRRQESPEMNIELQGRIRVRQEPGEELRYYGEVEPIPGRGGLDLYGRSFELTEGTITLSGPAAATRLDVMAQYQVPAQGGADDAGVLIDVHATGRPDSIALDFSAEPSMTQEDIVSYIVTGRPASDNPLVQQGSGVEGGQLALNALSEALAGAAGEELGFDVFQIRQNGAQGLTLTAGRYIASKLFVSLQQPLQLGGTAEQSATQSSGPGFELEYALERWLRATLRGGSLPSGFLFRGRYAY